MIRDRLLCSCVRAVGIALVLGISACEDWAPYLAFGQRYPDARLEIELSDATTKYDLYLLFEKAARLGGFEYPEGGRISEDELRGGDTARFFTWFPTPEIDRSNYRVAFAWPRGEQGNPKSFTFIFYNSSTNSFAEKEWLMFFEWKDEILPKVFPNASIEIAKHPAVATDGRRRQEISAATGIPLPDKYREVD